jgi:hypothetical protein
MGLVTVGWWYINADGTALMGGRNPVYEDNGVDDYGKDNTGPYGPYIKQ